MEPVAAEHDWPRLLGHPANRRAASRSPAPCRRRRGCDAWPAGSFRSIAFMPTAVHEMVLAVWMIARGFRPAAVPTTSEVRDGTLVGGCPIWALPRSTGPCVFGEESLLAR